MTLSHIEQLEWGICLIAWCALCGCAIAKAVLCPDADPRWGIFYAPCLAAAVLACIWYSAAYASWRT